LNQSIHSHSVKQNTCILLFWQVIHNTQCSLCFNSFQSVYQNLY
jgi:hypothetical protein